MRQQIRRATGHEHHGQRHDEGREVKDRDQRAVHRARAAGDENGGEARKRHAERAGLLRTCEVADEQRCHDRRQRDEAADGEVNASADDDQRHADGDDGDDGDLVGDVEEVFALEEVWPAVGLRLHDARVAQRGEVGGEVGEDEPAGAGLGAGDAVELAGGRGGLQRGAGVFRFAFHGGDDGGAGVGERGLERICKGIRIWLIWHGDEDARRLAKLAEDAARKLAGRVRASWVLLVIGREAEERAKQRQHEGHPVGGEEA